MNNSTGTEKMRRLNDMRINISAVKPMNIYYEKVKNNKFETLLCFQFYKFVK